MKKVRGERERGREGWARRRACMHARERNEERVKERDEDMVRGFIPQGCDSRTMYGYWAAGGIDSHNEGATDHPETETLASYRHSCISFASYTFYVRRFLRSHLYVKPSSLRFLPHSMTK